MRRSSPLSVVTGCGPDSESDAETSAKGPAGDPSKREKDGAAKPATGLPRVGSLKEVETFMGKTQLPCYGMSTDQMDDRLPADGFVDDVSESAPPSEQQEAAAWSIKEEGVCGEDWTNSYMVYLTKNMKAFQQRYKEYVLDNDRSGGSSSLTSGRFLVGDNFAVDPAAKIRDSGLLSTKLLLLNCDPELKVPSGYTKRPALVEGCVLTNYVAT
ncbi:hypothetical protein [Streptomyces sp. 3N207]|uniref:hypothetical protein n=1 Tax=Streptomyces sp. 3N207 TaxID=3457417 RepID=UPI003FD091FD